MPDQKFVEAQQQFKREFEGIVRDAVHKTEDVVLGGALTVCRKIVLGRGSALDCVRSLLKMQEIVHKRRESKNEQAGSVGKGTPGLAPSSRV